MSTELSVIERGIQERVRSEAAAAAPTATTTTSLRDFDEGDTVPARRGTDAMPFLGGRLSLGIGYTGGNGIGHSFTGVLGADVFLRQIANLGIGVRGVYLTPDRLLAGPAASVRIFTGDNPLFFDLEAGALFELPTATATRVTNTVAGYGSVGVGQEFGTTGARFFWRLGGHVIISDRLDRSAGSGAGGGVTVGAGVAF